MENIARVNYYENITNDRVNMTNLEFFFGLVIRTPKNSKLVKLQNEKRIILFFTTCILHNVNNQFFIKFMSLLVHISLWIKLISQVSVSREMTCFKYEECDKMQWKYMSWHLKTSYLCFTQVSYKSYYMVASSAPCVQFFFYQICRQASLICWHAI